MQARIRSQVTFLPLNSAALDLDAADSLMACFSFDALPALVSFRDAWRDAQSAEVHEMS